MWEVLPVVYQISKTFLQMHFQSLALTLTILLNLWPGICEGQLLKSQAKSDLQQLRTALQEIHPNLTLYRTQEQEAQHFRSMVNKLSEELSSVEFYKLVAEYLTFFRDGHTYPSMDFAQRAYQQSLGSSNSILPIEVDFKEDFFFIRNVMGGDSKANGCKLVSINGIPAETIVDSFQKFYCKAAAKLDNAHRRMFRTYYWLSFGAAMNWNVEYLNGNDIHRIDLRGLSIEQFQSSPAVKQNSQRMEDYSFRFIEDNSIGLLTMNGMADQNRFRKFAESTFQRLHEQQCQNLVIDMRNNGGGSSAIGDELFAYLSSRPYVEGKMHVKISQPIVRWYQSQRQGHPLFDLIVNGKPGSFATVEAPKTVPREVRFPFSGSCYLITGRKTYSSGHMFAGVFKCNQIGTVVGQPTGQATKTVGDSFRFRLSNSKIEINTSYKVFEGPCEPSFSNGFVPHHLVQYTPDELRSGVDKELALIKKLIQKRAQQRG